MAALLVGLIAIFDFSLPLGVAGGVPYVLLVLLGGWFPKPKHIIVLAIVGSIMTVFGYLFSPSGGISWVVLTNRGLALFVIWTTALLLIRQKQDQAVLGVSEARFRSLIDCSSQGILVHRNYKPLYANQALASMYDFAESDEILSLDSTEVLTSPEFNIGDHNRVLAGDGVSWDKEVRGRRRDGSEFWEIRRSFVIDWGGEPAVCSIRADISERKRAEEALRKSHVELEGRVKERTDELRAQLIKGNIAELRVREARDHLNLLLDSMAEGVVTIDAKGDVEYVNPVIEEMFGYSFKELEGKNISILMPKPYHADHDNYISNFLKSGKPKIIGGYREVSGKKKDGSVFPLDLSVNEFIDVGVVKFIGTLHDLTTRKQTEQALTEARKDAEDASRVKSEFLANMSHELRTPMNAILGFGQLMMNMPKERLAEKQDDYLRNILDSGNHLLQLINDILDISAIEAGKLEMHEEEVMVIPVVEEMVTLIQTRADSGKVNVSYEIDESLFAIRADSRRFKQILLNLLSNAVKFTPENGDVSISCHQDKAEGIRFVVSDTGLGMTPAGIKKALEPFGQAKSSLVRKQEGTGLGLPLSKQLVEIHGGTLDIESIPQEGTTVTVQFPLERIVSPH
ncbi:MAG: PAS domain S-box protein [Rhodospirillaceae bacterium]|nr:PAS domain S-box protein [Rhodospirillales bacterium]MBT3907259.1 PAS domain S-box protein [Rhodospirillaceae bacterium]MBT4701949.1 PAS domain S-box protein [Rhodospirillaceae bacterium]MBT5036747.1 PAS domain S-box protein [Rhodospirillaceae bacterium]MBT6220338.1 PAS domain S-box protein [Rhodospirillaceae bacterium]